MSLQHRLPTFTLDVPAGPIWDQADAETKCPIACASHGGLWNGQWTTVVPDLMSVCGCVRPIPADAPPAQFTLDVPAGPIWDQADAELKCPIACASHGGLWNGQWTTIVPDMMSVCGCIHPLPEFDSPDAPSEQAG